MPLSNDEVTKDNDLGCPKEGYDYWDDYKNYLEQLRAGDKKRGEERRDV